MVETMRIILVFIFLITLIPCSWASEYQFHPDPHSFVLEKIRNHDITFLGTTHRCPPVLSLVSSLIPELHKVGVTYILFEIASDQQDKLDYFLQTGEGLNDIILWPSIDCPEYRNLFSIIQNLPPAEKIIPVCIDLPISKLGGDINRDQWMAQSIYKIFHDNPNAKVFIKIGSLHTFKNLEWQDHVPNKRISIREELKRVLPDARIFSIVNVIDQKAGKCDFTREFGLNPDGVAVECDDRFLGWKAGFLSVIAIKPFEVCKLVDGLIVY
jgi:hypothetical protein